MPLIRHQCPYCPAWVEVPPSADVGHDCPLRLTPRGRRRWVWFVVVALTALLAACTTAAPTVAPAPTAAPTVAPAGTPAPLVHHGAVNPDVTQANISSTICKSGWTATIRPPQSYTAPIKRALWVQAGSKGKLSDYELDHWVPLEVGGAPRDPANLVLQPWTGVDGAHAKDAVENATKAKVCSGLLTLAQGQACFLDDWRRCR